MFGSITFASPNDKNMKLASMQYFNTKPEFLFNKYWECLFNRQLKRSTSQNQNSSISFMIN